MNVDFTITSGTSKKGVGYRKVFVFVTYCYSNRKRHINLRTCKNYANSDVNSLWITRGYRKLPFKLLRVKAKKWREWKSLTGLIRD